MLGEVPTLSLSSGMIGNGSFQPGPYYAHPPRRGRSHHYVRGRAQGAFHRHGCALLPKLDGAEVGERDGVAGRVRRGGACRKGETSGLACSV
jgi:hypothetical protein